MALAEMKSPEEKCVMSGSMAKSARLLLDLFGNKSIQIKKTVMKSRISEQIMVH